MADRSQVILENEILRVVILPFRGGKITSVFHKKRAFEAAAQAGKHAYTNISGESVLTPGQVFAPYAYGLDDAFPNIDKEEFIWKGEKRRYPDHGEIWNADFRILEQGKDFLKLCFESGEFSYRYRKELRLEENSLRMRYYITNTGTQALPAIWTWHGLMQYEEDMEILLPEKTRQCRNVLADDVLGKPDTIYPLRNTVYDFTKVPPSDSGRAVKYYVEPEAGSGGMEKQDWKPEHGQIAGKTYGVMSEAVQNLAAGDMSACCGFYYPSKNIYCLLRYDTEKLPYLGVWITAGGFQGDYNCALEPSNGFYDGVGRAAENGRLPVLAPGETTEFELKILLCEGRVDLK